MLCLMGLEMGLPFSSTSCPPSRGRPLTRLPAPDPDPDPDPPVPGAPPMELISMFPGLAVT